MAKGVRRDTEAARAAVKGGSPSAKLQVAGVINNSLRKHKISQAEAAAILGLSQPKVSALMNFHLRGFSLERLLRMLNSLGRGVVIRVSREGEQGPAFTMVEESSVAV